MALKSAAQKERHLSADTFLNLSCQVEQFARDYCTKTGCPAEQGVEALLSAAAHYALWSDQAATFTRVSGRLRTRVGWIARHNPEFFASTQRPAKWAEPGNSRDRLSSPWQRYPGPLAKSGAA